MTQLSYQSDPQFLRMSQFTLLKEGPMSNAKFDPGGLTKFGIAQNMHPEINVAHLTEEDALQFYYTDYYLLSCANLPYYGMGLCVFECAVNQGVMTSVHAWQDVLGLKKDGVGPISRAAIRAVKPESEVLPLFTAARIAAYVSIKDRNPNNYNTNQKGWYKRLAQCLIEGAK